MIVPVSGTQNYVVEARERIGSDADICSPGVLVYLVDQSVASGRAPGPIQVRAASAASDPGTERRCGLLYDAPYHHQRVAKFADTVLGFAMEVLGSTAEGFRVRVTGPAAVQPRAGLGTFIGGGSISFGPSDSLTTVFSDGMVDQLEASARGRLASGVLVQDAAGNFRLLVVGGPVFLKEQFQAAFPNGFLGPTAVTLTRSPTAPSAPDGCRATLQVEDDDGQVVAAQSALPYKAYGTGLCPGYVVRAWKGATFIALTAVDAAGGWAIDIPPGGRANVANGDRIGFTVDNEVALQSVTFQSGEFPAPPGSVLTTR